VVEQYGGGGGDVVVQRVVEGGFVIDEPALVAAEQVGDALEKVQIGAEAASFSDDGIPYPCSRAAWEHAERVPAEVDHARSTARRCRRTAGELTE
jgi:hypothetical protein